MGNLLGSPVTEKETFCGSIEPDVGSSSGGDRSSDNNGRSSVGIAGRIDYAVSSMQGWRIHMEDAHICEPLLYAEEIVHGPEDAPPRQCILPGHSLFAVCDGHGGSFAAEYAGRNLCRVLSREPKFNHYARYVQERDNKLASLKKESQQVAHDRNGLVLLEDALKDAFVNLDREIFLAIQGKQVPEGNKPYSLAQSRTDDDPSSSRPEGTAHDNSSRGNPASNGNNAHPPYPPGPNEDGDSGTTVVVVMVTPQWIVCANAGDSRAVFARQGHKVVPLSYDHKPDDEYETRRIKDAGGYVAGGRVEGDLAVSRGLGDFRFKEPSTVMGGADTTSGEDPSGNTNGRSGRSTTMSMISPDEQKVSPIPDVLVQKRNYEHDEFVLIACDGIWDVLSNYQAVELVAKIFNEGESNVGLLCEELLDMCLRLDSKDNMTALVVKFPAQNVGEGGGVGARRRAREMVDNPSAAAAAAAEEEKEARDTENETDPADT